MLAIGVDWVEVTAIATAIRGGEVVVQAASLEAAGFADREEPFDESVAVVGLGAVALLAPHDCVSQRALGGVVGGGHAGGGGERPECLLVLEQAGGEPAGLGVSAAGPLLEQVVQPLAVIGEVGAQRVQVVGVASGAVEDLERLSEGLLEVTAEPARGAVALGQRGEIAKDVSEAKLALGVVDE